MLYSSGTTGRPKGVWRPAPPEPVEELPPGDRMSAMAYGITPESVYLSPAPLYHSAPLTFLVQMGRIGAATVVMERFDPLAALECIERHRVTHSQWVPTMFVRMLRLTSDERARFDLSSHVFAIHGAGPCPIPVKEQMLDWWGPIIHEYYAGTEGAGTCVIGPREWLTHKGSVGRSVRGPMAILDDDGNELPPGEVGQVWFANSSEFRYLNDDAKTGRGAAFERPARSATSATSTTRATCT
jgi:long-chain acyl-CoA synthetase